MRITQIVQEKIEKYMLERRELIGMNLEEAIQKQVPKRPNYYAEGYADGELAYDYAQCPECGHDFEYGINDWGCAYCSDCGQKLDWTDPPADE